MQRATRPSWRRRKWIWGLLVFLLVLASARIWWAVAGTADSRPIILRGHVEAEGEVWVGVATYWSGVGPRHPIASLRTKGDFVLRGEVSPTAARRLILYATPTDVTYYLPVQCWYHRKLPPLRLDDDRWVEASTGEPLVAAIDLPVKPDGGAISCAHLEWP